MQASVLDPEDTLVNKTKTLPSLCLPFSGGPDNKQGK